MDPPIWRRLQLSSETTLTRLHHVLHVVMGWREYHLHGYVIDGVEYGPQTQAGGLPVIGERGLPLTYLVRTAPAQFIYPYDFGDGWTHTVDVEAITRPVRGKRYPVCFAGERVCPPEDAGRRRRPTGICALLERHRRPASPRAQGLFDDLRRAGTSFMWSKARS